MRSLPPGDGGGRARRELPRGGQVKLDCVFQGAGAGGASTDVRLSELFEPGKDSLVIYSFMFPRDPGDPTPGPRDGDVIRHFWSSELFYGALDPGQ